MGSKDAPLRDSLEEAWKVRNSGTPDLNDLLRFDIPIGRDRFAKAAAACEEVWKRPVPPAGAPPGAGVNFVQTSKLLEERFAQFNDYLAQAMETPLDFFKILKWAREPATAELRTKSLWANVWEELYVLAVAHGRQKALSRWNHAPTQIASTRLKQVVDARLYNPAETFVPGSRDWGFHPKDAELIYAPFIDRAAEARGRGPGRKLALLRARILMHHKNVAQFQKAQTLRRAASIYAKFRNLNLLDEIEATILSQEAKATDPLEAANRIWQTTGRRPSKYRINEGESGCFGVIWIDSGSPYGGGRAPSVYVELAPFPGHVFQTFDRGALAALAEDQLFRLVSESLTALGNFLLVYLFVLGFVIDFVTAGAASVTLRALLYNFIREKLIEAAVDKGLDLAKINSAPLRMLVQIGVGMKTGVGGKKLRSLREIEEEAATVAKFGKLKPARPAAASLGGSTRGGVGPADHFGTFDPDAVRVVTPEMRERIRNAARLQYAEEEDVLEELVERALQKVPDVATLFDARMTAPAARGTGLLMLHAAGAPAPSGVGKAGASLKARTKASKRVAKFENSQAYDALDAYRDFLTPELRTELLKARDDIKKRLQTDSKYTMQQANRQLKAIIDKAKDKSGEETVLVDVFSRFEVDETLSIPIRGKMGPPMLDVAVRLEKGQPFLFVLVEAKGNITTGLGKVTRKEYFYVNNLLDSIEVPSGGFVRQGNGEWYYQKFAEIYLSGQRLGGSQGKAIMSMALELMEAAKRGKVRFEVMKTSPHLTKEIDDTATVAAWFSQKLAPVPKGTLPIPVSVKR